MRIPVHQLEAFHAVAQTGSFSRAARRLHVTQPALSQRVRNLEETLGSLVFLRGAGGVRLTPAGQRLLRYCEAHRALEAELLSDLGDQALRVAGFSSVVRSAVLPALAPLVRFRPHLVLDVASRETKELPGLLDRGEADLVLLDRKIRRFESAPLGHEELVLVESRRHRGRDHVLLDHDADDETSLRFVGKKIERSFLDDIYGILDGVAMGLGRAVVPRHLVTRELRVVPGSRTARSPVFLHWLRQPSYSRVHLEAREALLCEVPRILST